MELKTNNINIVAIGCFNPAILTPDFLIKNCNFPKDLNLVKKQILPVVSSLDFGEISFVAELERFQIVENNVIDTKKPKLIEYFQNYFNTLKYTPIRIAGLNFNFKLSDYPKSIIKLLDNIDNIVKFSGVNEINYVNQSIIKNKKMITQLWEYTYKVDENSRIQFRINRNNGELIVNSNFEIKVDQIDEVDDFVIIKDFLDIENLCKSFLDFISGEA